MNRKPNHSLPDQTGRLRGFSPNLFASCLLPVFFFVIFFFAGAVAGEERKLSLPEALRIALAANHELKSFTNTLSAEKESIGVARSFLLPRITFEERFLRTTNPTYSFMAKLNQERFTADDFAVASLNNPDPINDFQTSFSVEQPVFVKKAFVGLACPKRRPQPRKKNSREKRKRPPSRWCSPT